VAPFFDTCATTKNKSNVVPRVVCVERPCDDSIARCPHVCTQSVKTKRTTALQCRTTVGKSTPRGLGRSFGLRGWRFAIIIGPATGRGKSPPRDVKENSDRRTHAKGVLLFIYVYNTHLVPKKKKIFLGNGDEILFLRGSRVCRKLEGVLSSPDKIPR